MATTYATEVSGVLDGTEPASKSDGAVHGARMIRRRATITLASQASGSIIVLAEKQVGEHFAYGVITSDTSLGSATAKIGPESSDAAYRAAATFTATNAPTMFGPAAAISSEPATDGENIILTTATAALPASGTLVVDLYFSKA